MSIFIPLTLAFIGLHAPPHPSLLPVACDSNSSVTRECFDEFKNAGKKMLGQENETDRAQTTGEAVRNCWNCASETLSDTMRNFNSNSSDGNTSRSNER
ncbi:hypothetical protein [Bradyrhizobium sp. Cp5.3]|uniref:hypothetical protein n=1 Tax=Bradyrhizobium sp. Cp5.3 TaxID=443598 RepID=UPI00041BD84D|nr:hypothetical protein [Bradyrhizobium sp. Cp5.3]